jgi:hypothetical protein
MNTISLLDRDVENRNAAFRCNVLQHHSSLLGGVRTTN